jgi:hypothetical protein
MTKATLILCLIGAGGSLAIGFAGLGWTVMSVEDALIFPLVMGPYAMLAGLTVWRRSKPKEVRILAASVIVVVAYGCWGFGTSLYRRHSIPDAKMVMDLSPLVVPALQWAFTCIVGIILSAKAAITSVVPNL